MAQVYRHSPQEETRSDFKLTHYPEAQRRRGKPLEGEEEQPETSPEIHGRDAEGSEKTRATATGKENAGLLDGQTRQTRRDRARWKV